MPKMSKGDETFVHCTLHYWLEKEVGKKESRGEPGQFCWGRGESGRGLREAAWIRGEENWALAGILGTTPAETSRV